MMDVRTVFPNALEPPYVPESYDRKYHGPQLARYALRRFLQHPRSLADATGRHEKRH